MASTALSRPNHYELLGVEPGASVDEILRAFASMMRHGQRSFGTATQIYAAFETLRDPDKRRAYDDAMGLTAKPPTPRWTIGAQQNWAPSRAAPVPAPAAQPAASAAASALEPKVAPDPAVDPRVAAIAASLRELARPAPLRPEPDPRPAPDTRSRPEPEVEHVIEHILAVGHAEKRQLRFEATRSPGWRKPAVIAGGLLVGVGLLGALVGLTAREGEEAKPAAPTVFAIPKPSPEIATAAPEPAATLAPAQAEPPLPQPPAAALPKRIHIPQQNPPAKAAEPSAVTTTPDQTAPDALASDPLAPAPAGSTPAADAMPLPKSVVARTIERIGYACGAVASTTATEGAGPGVYTVTCTSGQNYQATPVNGRYHFRRVPAR